MNERDTEARAFDNGKLLNNDGNQNVDFDRMKLFADAKVVANGTKAQDVNLPGLELIEPPKSQQNNGKPQKGSYEDIPPGNGTQKGRVPEIQADNTSIFDQKPDTCTPVIVDSRYEQYIKRDHKGRVLSTHDGNPRVSYGKDGNVSRVTFDEGTLVFRAHYYEQKGGKWFDQDGEEVKGFNFNVDQVTGEMQMNIGSAVKRTQADGTSLIIDESGKVLSTDNNLEHRDFHYDADGRLTSVDYRKRSERFRFGSNAYGDKWERQSDGTFVNMKDGKPTGRALKNIEVSSDGTYSETDFQCRTRVFRLEHSNR